VAPALPEPPAAPRLQLEPNTAPLQVANAAAVATPAAVVAPAAVGEGSADALPAAAEPMAPPPAHEPARLQHLRVEIANGNGVTGMAAWLGGWLQQRGLGPRARLTNLLPYATPATVVYYRNGFVAEAMQIAQRMPQHVALAPEPGSSAGSDVRVVLGHDLRARVACTPQCRAEPHAVLAVNNDTTR
jgi:hypothetical protein